MKPDRPRFPPPPPPLPGRPVGSSNSTPSLRLPLPPPPTFVREGELPASSLRPHESIAPTFILQSAPPSGNMDAIGTAQVSPVAGHSKSINQSSFSNAMISSSSPTIVSLPPPPPQSNSSRSLLGLPQPPKSGNNLQLPKPSKQTTAAISSPSLPSVLRRPKQRPGSPPPPPRHRPSSPSESVHSEEDIPEQEPLIVVYTTANPPPRLPPTTFLTKSALPPLLAKRQTHIPILVLATESAQKMAYKNKLRLSDMLEGLIQQGTHQQQQSSTKSNTTPPSITTAQYPFRSVHRQIHISSGDVSVRFVEPEQLYQPLSAQEARSTLSQHALLRDEDGNLHQELAVLEDQVDHLLDRANESNNNKVTNEMNRHAERAQQMEQAVKDAYALTSPLHIPWLWRYRLACDAVTDDMPWDLTCAPVLILCICTTSEELGWFETIKALIRSPYTLPRPYHNGLLDPNTVRKEALVLHDNVDGPPSGDSSTWNETSIRQTLVQNFGANASFIRCNSISVETAHQLAQEETKDLWSGGGTLGSCLSVADRANLRKYLSNLLTSALLPAMERRIADLNVTVSEKKKGVKNALKSLWGGRTSTGISGTGGSSYTITHVDGSSLQDGNVEVEQPVAYRHDTVESQTRLLADSLFLMKDYEAALGMYRLIKDDFKQDKTHGHYANVQEMMALCMYLTDPYGRSKDIFSYCENALLGYSRAAEYERPSSWEKQGRPATAPHSTRLATRLCLVLVSTKNICVDRHLEVADLLASASSSETSLGAAVLLEQSSSHYFKANMYRKYAFHMLMSGHMFRSAEQEHHAFRCFTSALHIYRDSKWEELHNHLLSALAAQLYAMDRMAMSLQLYSKLVGSTEGGRVSPKTQQKFINHLLEICSENPKKALVGADRMAASGTVSTELRDSVRKERLDRIVQVVRYTKSASRVLELPNIHLPGVDNSTIVVHSDQSSTMNESSIPSLGDIQRGSEDVWEELELIASAELKLLDSVLMAYEEEIIPGLSNTIGNKDTRKLVSLIVREKVNRNIHGRAKQSESHSPNLPLRSQNEPLVIEFAISNPLGIPIDIVDIQIVARMTDENGIKICTNEDSIKITPLVSYDRKPSWTFLGSSVNFEIPNFCRVGTCGVSAIKQSWKSAEETNPFFVVTKTSISLEPESRRTIAASICPLIKGNLEITGVRCRLFDDVWVFHPFELKGPLLQNTRSNRANRVRAEPTLLKAKVERGMPCLKAELLRPSGTELQEIGPHIQGQVSSWLLRLSNVGTASARNLYLKSSHPWILIDIDEETGKSFELGCPCCVGSCGTLFEIPLLDSCLKNASVIDPGENITVPIRIRVDGCGRQDFYLLFRYELFEDSVKVSPSYRWLRLMVQVPVYPSLSITASTLPSFSHEDQHIVSVEFTNIRHDRPDKLHLVLEYALLASRRYKLDLLPGQFSEVNRANLGWQERASVFFRVELLENALGSLKLSECRFNSSTSTLENQETASLSTLYFPCLVHSFDSFQKTLALQRFLANDSTSQGKGHEPRSIAQIRRANTSSVSLASSASEDGTHSTATSTSTSFLCPADRSEESLCLIFSWRDQDGVVAGEHFIRDLEIRPAFQDDECPISVHARHPCTVSMHPDEAPVHVPVDITMRNKLTKGSVEFHFSLERCEGVEFTGPDNFSSLLSGGEEVSVPIQALIACPGIYNLQQIRLTLNNKVRSTFVFPAQWLVTVNALT